MAGDGRGTTELQETRGIAVQSRWELLGIDNHRHVGSAPRSGWAVGSGCRPAGKLAFYLRQPGAGGGKAVERLWVRFLEQHPINPGELGADAGESLGKILVIGCGFGEGVVQGFFFLDFLQAFGLDIPAAGLSRTAVILGSVLVSEEPSWHVPFWSRSGRDCKSGISEGLGRENGV